MVSAPISGSVMVVRRQRAEEVEAEVSAAFGPFVGLFGEHGVD